MRRFRFITTLVVAMMAMAAIGLFGAGAAAAAQEDTIGIGISKYNCPSGVDGESDLSSCQLGAGVSFEVATADGEVLGSCTTEITRVQDSDVAYCAVDNVGYDTPLVITEDVSTGPAGYVPVENPQTMTIQRPELEGQDFAPRAVFINVEEASQVPPVDSGEADSDTGVDMDTETDTDTDTDDGDTDAVVSLPDTGTGGAPATSLSSVALLTLLAVTCAGIGLHLRTWTTA